MSETFASASPPTPDKESCVVGSILNDGPSAFRQLVSLGVTGEMFCTPLAARVWAAAKRLEADRPGAWSEVDLYGMVEGPNGESLAEMGAAQVAGGSFSYCIPTYAADVIEAHRRRLALADLDEIRARLQGGEDVREKVATLAAEVAGMSAAAPVKACSVRFDEAIRAEDIDRPAEVVKGFICRKTVGGVAAGAGLGKSKLMAQLVGCTATGRDWIDLPTVQGAALLFDLEMPRDLTFGKGGRLACQFQGVNVDGAPAYYVPMFDESLHNPALKLTADVDAETFGGGRYAKKRISVETFKRRLDAEVKAHKLEQTLSLVVIDGLVEFSGGKIDEQAAQEVRPLIQALRAVAVERNIAIVLVLHPGKNAGERAAEDFVRGSSSHLDTLDWLCVLRKHSGENGEVIASLETAKNRWYGILPTRWVRSVGASPWERTERPPDADAQSRKGHGKTGAQGGQRRGPGAPSGYDYKKILACFPPGNSGPVSRETFLAALQDAEGKPSADTVDRWLARCVSENHTMGDGRRGWRLTPQGEQERASMQGDMA